MDKIFYLDSEYNTNTADLDPSIDIFNTTEKFQIEQILAVQSKSSKPNMESPFLGSNWINLGQINNGNYKSNDELGFGNIIDQRKSFQPELDESYEQTMEELKRTVKTILK